MGFAARLLLAIGGPLAERLPLLDTVRQELSGRPAMR
jgi:hypothetical protein